MEKKIARLLVLGSSGLTLALAKGALADVDLDIVVLVDPEATAEDIVNQPVGNGVAVVRGRGVRSRGTARDADLAQDGADIGLGHGDQEVGLADLGHGRDNKVGVDVLDSHALGGQLGTNGLGPAGEESLGARVDREVRGRDQSSEGAQVDNQTVLAIKCCRPQSE